MPKRRYSIAPASDGGARRDDAPMGGPVFSCSEIA
jgi:hypothetical protein